MGGLPGNDAQRKCWDLNFNQLQFLPSMLVAFQFPPITFLSSERSEQKYWITLLMQSVVHYVRYHLRRYCEMTPVVYTIYLLWFGVKYVQNSGTQYYNHKISAPICASTAFRPIYKSFSKKATKISALMFWSGADIMRWCRRHNFKFKSVSITAKISATILWT